LQKGVTIYHVYETHPGPHPS